MGKAHNNDNDIVKLKEKNNDNDIVREEKIDLREKVLEEISEHKLRTIQDFLFGGPSNFYGDCGVFVNPAIKQMERFTYIWLYEVSEETRKAIITYYLGAPGDDRVRDYKSYTNCPIWKYISSIIKMINGYKCASCGQQYNPAHLVVHHRSYAHLGSEIFYLSEMDVLCTNCHMRTHGIRSSK